MNDEIRARLKAIILSLPNDEKDNAIKKLLGDVYGAPYDVLVERADRFGKWLCSSGQSPEGL